MATTTQFRIFVFLCIVSMIFWWHDLARLVRLAIENDAYTHVLLIPPLVVALIYFGPRTPPAQSLPRTRLGAVLLAVSLLLTSYAHWKLPPGVTVSLSAPMLALVVWWIASVVLCFGTSTVRLFLFPVCFLLLMIPIPDPALARIVEFLQNQSAFASRVLFRLIGVPATQDGFMVSIPGLDIEVAQECSSIRSSMMLLVTTIVFAQLFLRSWWRKALLIAAAVPLSVAKNGLRIVTIAELGTRVDPAFLTGKFHHHGGIVFYGISVVAMAAVVWFLRLSETPVPTGS